MPRDDTELHCRNLHDACTPCSAYPPRVVAHWCEPASALTACDARRVAARTKNTANSGAYNLGARCARGATPEETLLVETGMAVEVGAPEVGNAAPPSTAGVTDGAKVGYHPGQHAATGPDEL